jgi:predicted small lipoprotein YifL
MKTIRHYQNTVISILLALLLLVFLIGCQSKAPSMLDPDEQVTKSVLEEEFKFLSAQINADIDMLRIEYQKRLEEIARKEQLKAAFSEAAAVMSRSGEMNPIGIVTLILAVLGVGSIADNRKKDGIIKGLKNAR